VIVYFTIATSFFIISIFMHQWVVVPRLEKNGFEPRHMEDWLIHKDWLLYLNKCNGNKSIFYFMWFSYLFFLSFVVWSGIDFFVS